MVVSPEIHPPHLGASLALPLPGHTHSLSIASKIHFLIDLRLFREPWGRCSGQGSVSPSDGDGLRFRLDKRCPHSEAQSRLKPRSF